MKRFLFISAMSVLTMAGWVSCLKSEIIPPSPPPKEDKSKPVPFPKDALPYLQMPDRVFAYKDSATGNIDSVKLLYCSISVGMVLPSNWSGPPLSAPYTYFEVFNFSLVPVDDLSEWLNGSSQGADFSGHYAQLPLQGKMKKINWYGEVFSSYQKPAAMAVEGKDYADVVRSPYDLRQTDDVFYWAKGVGIIKFTIRHNANEYTYTLVN